MTIAILGAMPEEVDSLVDAMSVRDQGLAGRCRWWRGELYSAEDVVVTFSQWGKVAAASTATWLVATFDVEELLFTGVAGAMSPDLRPGDIVIGNRLWQHDFDARPLIPRHEIPLLGTAVLQIAEPAQKLLQRAARHFVDNDYTERLPASTCTRFNLQAPRVVVGGIASGDRFVHDAIDVADIVQRLPDVVCVEMEGAAVAQVCAAFGVPFSIVRTISDSADATAPVDFQGFVDEVARVYATGIVEPWLADRMSSGD